MGGLAREPAESPGLPWLARRVGGWSERKLVVVITLTALAIRIYLSLTSFCVAADGVYYISMARAFSGGRPGNALASVLSPLYPWLVSLLYRVVPDWETAGELVSTGFGTATVPLLYWLISEAHGRRDLALGAAALAAIHPALAEYSASVRTEAGFICLTVAALYLFSSGVNRRQLFRIVCAGAVGGVAYLYRAEGIGLLIVCIAILLVGAIAWRAWSLGTAMCWSLLFAAAFLAVASPYLIYLHRITGHWVVSRQLNLVASESVMEVARDKAAWLALERSGSASILAPLFTDPRVYLYKVGYDAAMSFYYFSRAIDPVLAVFLIAGLWIRRRGLFSSFGESLLAFEVVFYFFGLALFNTGPRFMVHLIAYTFGWVMVGVDAASRTLGHIKLSAGRTTPSSALMVALALVLLPQALWPLGYDLRGLRYAAADIAQRGPKPRAIACGDPRLAFYAGAEQIRLPARPNPDVCGWLSTEPDAGYLMVSDKDELRWGDLRRARCLSFVKRYPRTRDHYYDLFQVRRLN